MAYASRLTGSGDLKVWLPALREARDAWCRDNGCHSVGETCAEVYGKPCADGARGAA